MPRLRLSRSTRHVVYIIMHAEACNWNNIKPQPEGFCELLFNLTDLWPICDRKELTEWLPELKKHKPAKIGNYDLWFAATKKGWLKRASILKQCIEETA